MRLFYRPRGLPSGTAMGPLIRCKQGYREAGGRCQRTVLRGQQAPENRCRTQGRKRRRSGGRSSRRTSGTKMPRCRSELPAARREHGRGWRSFRAPRTAPTERARSPKCAAERVATTTDAGAESVVCLLREDAQLGPQRPRREDDVGAITRVAPTAHLRTGRLRSPSAFGAVISRFSIEHFLKLPRLDGRKHPAHEFRWNRRQPFAIDELAFDEVGSSPKPIGGGEQPGVNQRRSADDNDPAIAKQKPPHCHSCT